MPSYKVPKTLKKIDFAINMIQSWQQLKYIVYFVIDKKKSKSNINL